MNSFKKSNVKISLFVLSLRMFLLVFLLILVEIWNLLCFCIRTVGRHGICKWILLQTSAEAPECGELLRKDQRIHMLHPCKETGIPFYHSDGNICVEIIDPHLLQLPCHDKDNKGQERKICHCVKLFGLWSPGGTLASLPCVLAWLAAYLHQLYLTLHCFQRHR